MQLLLSCWLSQADILQSDWRSHEDATKLLIDPCRCYKYKATDWAIQVLQSCWLIHADATKLLTEPCRCYIVADWSKQVLQSCWLFQAGATKLLTDPSRCYKVADWAMPEKNLLLLCLLGLSTILYSLAAVSHAWFTLPPHSFYGLWSVVFCDFLQCQIISALFSDEPGMVFSLIVV